jgi:Leucine-rich repeat (LRR) protein
LRHLGLLRTAITDASAKVIAGFEDLETLDLSYTSISDEGLSALQPLVGLRDLGLDSTYVTDNSRGSFLAMHKLEKLDLYHT